MNKFNQAPHTFHFSLLLGICMCLMSVSSHSYGQENADTLSKYRPGKLRSFGKNAMTQGDYQSAIPYWEAYLKSKPDNAKAIYALAECYKNSRDYVKAQEMYRKAYDANPSKYILALFYQAAMLKMMGDYDHSKQRFAKFAKEYKGLDKSFKKLAKNEINGCDTAKILLNVPAKVIVTHLDTSINKGHMEMSPISTGDSSFIYAALRTDKKVYIDPLDTAAIPVRKFYAAQRKNGQWLYQGEMQGPFNVEGENTGNGSFSIDKKRFYFSRCKKNWKNETQCAIYVSTLENGQWSEPEMLSKTINDPAYIATQPAVAFDPVKKREIIFFVSNRPKGKGGFDIWYTIYDEKKKIYKSPKNAGASINTPGSEMTPFYDQDTRHLYFSSDGLTGMGGMDLYKILGEPGKWGVANNLGAPINSSADDIYYSIAKNREEGFFVSNRKGGAAVENQTCCDDIYSFKYKQYIHIQLCGTVQQLTKDKQQEVIADQSMVSLLMLDPKSNEEIVIQTIQTGPDGKYCFQAEQGNHYRISVVKEGYLNTKKDISTDSIQKSTRIDNRFTMEALPEGPVKIKNLHYDFDKSTLSDNAKTVLDTTIYKIMMENPDIIVEISSHTDSKGTDSYNLKLSQKRADAAVEYLISKGISKNRLVAKGYGETKPVAENELANGADNPEGREKNRRSEFKIIGKTTREIITEED